VTNSPRDFLCLHFLSGSANGPALRSPEIAGSQFIEPEYNHLRAAAARLPCLQFANGIALQNPLVPVLPAIQHLYPGGDSWILECTASI